MASQEAKNYAFALSQLKQRVLESAPFFKHAELDGGHLDDNILIELINIAIEAQEEYQKNQDQKIKDIQKMLTERIKNNEIEREEAPDEAIEGSVSEEEIPTIDLE